MKSIWTSLEASTSHYSGYGGENDLLDVADGSVTSFMAANVTLILNSLNASYSDVMACAEENRLRQTYDEALRAWSLSRFRLMNGVCSVETSLMVRKQLLSARMKAANDLYHHSVTCPSCRMSRIHLMEDE
jgi:hypothetical protein